MSLLILGGTGEARALAEALCDVPGARVSLAGATRRPKTLPLPVRHGGFGGAEGFSDYLRSEGIATVLDATHPFAVRITARSRAVCDRLGVSYGQVLRPPWDPGPGDRWHQVADAAAAVAAVPAEARVFLATGRQSLDDFHGLHALCVFVRVIDPPDAAFPFAEGRYVVGRPPFTVAEEMALFKLLDVNWLIVKNSGGALGWAKLQAARALGLSVAMIARPQGPTDRLFTSVAEALAWVRQEAQV